MLEMPAQQARFTVTGRLHSFRFAVRGLRTLVISQHNAWIHAVATILVCIFGVAVNLSAAEWCGLALAITAVWAAEAFNTAIELVCDAASPGFHPLIGKAKDVAAGAVLITAIGACCIALLVFLPHFRSA